MWPEWSAVAVADHSRFWCSAPKLGQPRSGATTWLPNPGCQSATLCHLSHRNLRVFLRFLPHLLTTPLHTVRPQAIRACYFRMRSMVHTFRHISDALGVSQRQLYRWQQYIASQTMGVCRQANHIKGMIHAEASSLRLQKLAEVTGTEVPLRVVAFGLVCAIIGPQTQEKDQLPELLVRKTPILRPKSCVHAGSLSTVLGIWQHGLPDFVTPRQRYRAVALPFPISRLSHPLHLQLGCVASM